MEVFRLASFSAQNIGSFGYGLTFSFRLSGATYSSLACLSDVTTVGERDLGVNDECLIYRVRVRVKYPL